MNVLTLIERNLITPLIGNSMLEFGNKKNRRGTYKACFSALGIDHVSVDINGKDGALERDLQEPLDLGRFDMVTNFGTTEHVAKQEPAWRNAIEATGLVFVSTTPLPGCWKNHGRWYPTEEFYEELARLNGFRIERLYVDGITDDKQLICVRMCRERDVPFSMPSHGMIHDNDDYGVGRAE